MNQNQSSTKQPITAWYTWNFKTKMFDFNHIEDDHATGEFPKPKSPEFVLQKTGWKTGRWTKIHCFLDHGKVLHEDGREVDE